MVDRGLGLGGAAGGRGRRGHALRDVIGHALWTGLPGLIGGLSGAYFSRRRIEGRMSERERGEWRSMNLRERARVRHAVRRGRAVEKPRYARVAAELAASLHAENRRALWAFVFLLVLFGAAAIPAFAERLEGLGAVFLVAAVAAAIGAASMPGRRRRLASAEEANRRASTPDLESPAPAPTGGAQ